MVDRRSFLAGTLGGAWAVAGCKATDPFAHVTGGFSGAQPERGHHMRDMLQPGKANTWAAPGTRLR